MCIRDRAWIGFDPFTQAVYCVRGFRLESRETGEDLRAALRPISHAGATAAVLLLIAGTLRAQVTPANLDASIRRTVQSSEYNWRLASPVAKRAGHASWLVTLTDRLADGAQQALRSVGHAIDRLVDWLREKLPDGSTDTASPPASALRSMAWPTLRRACWRCV